MKKMSVGERVVATNRIILLISSDDRSLIIVPKGMIGTVTDDRTRGRREVRFDNGIVATAPTTELSAAGVLDRIASSLIEN